MAEEMSPEALESFLHGLLQTQTCPNKRAQVDAARALVVDYAKRIRVAVAEEELNVDFLRLSGELLGSLQLTRATLVSNVREQLRPLLGDHGVPSKLVYQGNVLRDFETIGNAGITFNSTVQVVLEPAAYLVEGAGVEIVNGRYFKSSRRMNDATAFTNNRGIMLFRYVMNRGTPYWYFSDVNDLKTKHGDYYRIRTTESLPPPEGWTSEHCPKGGDTACPRLRALLEPEILMEPCPSDPEDAFDWSDAVSVASDW